MILKAQRPIPAPGESITFNLVTRDADGVSEDTIILSRYSENWYRVDREIGWGKEFLGVFEIVHGYLLQAEISFAITENICRLLWY